MNSEVLINIVHDSDFQSHVIESVEPVVVIFEKCFWALAQVMSAILEKLADKYRGKIRFYKYNLDEHTSIADYYQIENSTTVLFFKNGNLYTRTGVDSIETLEKILVSMIDG